MIEDRLKAVQKRVAKWTEEARDAIDGEFESFSSPPQLKNAESLHRKVRAVTSSSLDMPDARSSAHALEGEVQECLNKMQGDAMKAFDRVWRKR
mmetsp:Transcript_31039/g.78151  ORF Transcript_31039/g.78151 Transcript_31039/m.78151 type:complete len:94 (-) Transcript_31039:596-877(-)|eukprot:CAMPEP_0173431694 /NCGR_PEP_ID=MMETSP1357-20121228/9752_1 /TAXON_ID=77926 /ORGANISM="Hemiselmis rufescens, Strain PCC563" /LENGTH=93 /DNA_ID=CAMNT_0014396199 /DNA_START=101 /DNA_END=382 /DNA_ORIENTATION=-